MGAAWTQTGLVRGQGVPKLMLSFYWAELGLGASYFGASLLVGGLGLVMTDFEIMVVFNLILSCLCTR